MRNKENMEQLFSLIKEKQGPSFSMDEEAIRQAYQKNTEEQSIALKILAICGAIFGNLTFIGFLYVAGIYDSPMALSIVGAISIAGSLLISKFSKKITYDALSISSYLIGLIVIAAALTQLEASENIIASLILLISIGTLLLVENYVHVFFAVLTLIGALLFLFVSNFLYEYTVYIITLLGLLTSYVFLNEGKIITRSKWMNIRYKPIRIALVIAFLNCLNYLTNYTPSELSLVNHWLNAVALVAVIAWVVYRIMENLALSNKVHKIGIYAFMTLFILPTTYSLGITGSLLIILLSYQVNYRTSFVLGIIYFIGFLIYFYYNLQITLIVKSMLLIIPGILALGVYIFTQKLLSDEKI